MSDNKSPVESDSSSVKFDPDSREIKLEQKPGEQPVTVAGGSEGPEIDSTEDDEQ